MSKAFIKESDEVSDLDEPDTTVDLGQTKNYITPGGLKRLQDELYQLKHKERPEVCAVVSWAAENGDRSENADYIYGKKRLREIDRRIRFLAKRLDTVEVVDPLLIEKKDQVLIGATVTVVDEEGIEKTYAIVGVDETDLSKGRVSWISPIGQALMKASVDDVVIFRSPKGVRELEIKAIQYIELP